MLNETFLMIFGDLIFMIFGDILPERNGWFHFDDFHARSPITKEHEKCLRSKDHHTKYGLSTSNSCITKEGNRHTLSVENHQLALSIQSPGVPV